MDSFKLGFEDGMEKVALSKALLGRALKGSEKGLKGLKSKIDDAARQHAVSGGKGIGPEAKKLTEKHQRLSRQQKAFITGRTRRGELKAIESKGQKIRAADTTEAPTGTMMSRPKAKAKAAPAKTPASRTGQWKALEDWEKSQLKELKKHKMGSPEWEKKREVIDAQLKSRRKDIMAADPKRKKLLDDPSAAKAKADDGPKTKQVSRTDLMTETGSKPKGKLETATKGKLKAGTTQDLPAAPVPKNEGVDAVMKSPAAEAGAQAGASRSAAKAKPKADRLPQRDTAVHVQPKVKPAAGAPPAAPPAQQVQSPMVQPHQAPVQSPMVQPPPTAPAPAAAAPQQAPVMPEHTQMIPAPGASPGAPAIPAPPVNPNAVPMAGQMGPGGQVIPKAPAAPGGVVPKTPMVRAGQQQGMQQAQQQTPQTLTRLLLPAAAAGAGGAAGMAGAGAMMGQPQQPQYQQPMF